MLGRHITIVICLLLVVLTLAVFAQTLWHDFIRLDDDVYITLNEQVLQYGLSRATIWWALTTKYNANWHPLTWISYLTDAELFEFEPWGYHLTNLLLHVANVLLLFLVLSRMTGSVWKSAFVAALFAIHPLHVESVAWVAERKDVLSTFLWLLTMWAYVRYTERASMTRQLALWAVFALGLMAKPMLVTLPLVLLLLDYWPLGRTSKTRFLDLVWEKLPIFGFSLASCIITFQAQSAGGAVGAVQLFTPLIRANNAVVAYVSYMLKTIVPIRLSVYYPHFGPFIPVWQVVGSALILTAITVLVVRAARTRRYLPVGWFWYLVTLVPVIGIVQVGSQAMADRYTYVPLIGLFIIAAWGIPDIVKRSQILRVPAVIVILLLAAVAARQASYWKDSVTLFEHGISVTQHNSVLHADLGLALRDLNRNDEAIAHYEEALRINPRFAEAHNNLAVALYFKGDYKGAWREAHLAAQYGVMPDQGFLQALSEQMPDPAEQQE